MEHAEKAEQLHLIAQAVADAAQEQEEYDLEAVVIVMEREPTGDLVPMAMASTVNEDTTTMMLVSCLPEQPGAEPEPTIWTPNKGITH